MPREYVVKAGDNLSKIAREQGLATWRDIYFYADNAEFRRKRPNPNLILPGDKVFLPDKDEPVAVPAGVDVPTYLRLPFDFASEWQISPFIPLALGSSSSSMNNSGSVPGIGYQPGSLLAQILDPAKSDPVAPVPVRPLQPMWQFGGAPPLLSSPCGPWGCARGPLHLDRPRPGYFGDVKNALLSTPQISNGLGSIGNYLWSGAPLGRRVVVGSIAGLGLVGGVTALASSESLRNFALEKLDDVALPVGEAILMIPGVDSNRWVSAILRPVEFSLIWHEPGPISGPPEIGTPSGLQGRGGMLILNLQKLVGDKN